MVKKGIERLYLIIIFLFLRSSDRGPDRTFVQ